MGDSVEFLGRPTETGHFAPEYPKALAAFLRSKAGKKDALLRVTIEDWKPTRSNQQSRAWWGLVVKPFCEYMGYRYSSEHDRRYVHEQILIAIGHCEDAPELTGEVRKRALPTHDLKADKFWELYEGAQELGAGLGIVIPDPERAKAM